MKYDNRKKIKKSQKNSKRERIYSSIQSKLTLAENHTIATPEKNTKFSKISKQSKKIKKRKKKKKIQKKSQKIQKTENWSSKK